MSRENSPAESAPSFDRLARPYRWLEYFSFGPFLQRARVHYLPQFSGCRRALVLGDGDGRFTSRLLGFCPQVFVDAIDASPAMLKVLTERAGPKDGPDASRVATQCADIRCWQPEPSAGYNLVATHFFLDCLTTQEVAELAQRIRPSLDPCALWVVSDFAIPASGFRRAIAIGLVWWLYRAFGLLTGLRVRRLPDHAAALKPVGFTRVASHSQLGGLLVSELWQLALPALSGESTPADQYPRPAR